MRALPLFLVSTMPIVVSAQSEAPQKIRNDESLKVQEELRPPRQKLTQEMLEAKVRDNLFKKEEKEEKEEAKKQ